MGPSNEEASSSSGYSYLVWVCNAHMTVNGAPGERPGI